LSVRASLDDYRSRRVELRAKANNQLSSPLAHLEACQQADVARRAPDTFLSGAACSAGSRELGPLACELPARFLFVIDAALYRLINGEAGIGCNVELATSRDIKLRHLVSHGND